MKKARLVLSLVALVALGGGMLAFKAARFNGFRVYTSTLSYSTFGTLYTRAVPACLPALPTRFITTTGTVPTTVYSTTGTTTTAPIILTQVGGTATITFPAFTCSLLTSTFTQITN